jgi:hypothetical protein
MKYLPISPGAPHPDNGLLLELEGDPLLYNGCVKISEALKFRIGVLQPTMTEHKLTSTSYNTLKRYTSDVPVHTFVPAAKLEQTIVHREALALSSKAPDHENNPTGSIMSASKSSSPVHPNHSPNPPQLRNGAFKQAQQRSTSEPNPLQSGTDDTFVHQNQDPVRPLTQRQKRNLLLLGSLCIDAVFVLIVAVGLYLFC